MATHLRPFTHRRTDSEAMADLNSVFKSVDIDGEGKLDQASFLTALMSLEVQLSENDLSKIFEELDENETGYIEYDRVTEFLKMGKIPSSLLNKVKKSKAPRKSIIIGQANGNKNNQNNIQQSLLTQTSSNSLLVPNQQGQIVNPVSKMDPARKKLIQRAVIVIKKAMMKNITRNEVFEFLTAKGMAKEDIEIAYVRAQESVMSPDERLKYLQDLAESRLTEISDYQKVNKYLTNEITSHTREIEVLKSILNVCTKTFLNTFAQKYKQIPPKGVRDEIKQRLKKTQTDFESADEMKDERATRVHQKDMNTLTQIDKCLTDGRHFHAYLSFHQLDEVIRSGMPVTQQFLANFSDPNTQDDESYD